MLATKRSSAVAVCVVVVRAALLLALVVLDVVADAQKRKTDLKDQLLISDLLSPASNRKYTHSMRHSLFYQSSIFFPGRS